MEPGDQRGELDGGRLQSLRSGPPATPTARQDLAYTYDLTGNVATIMDAGAATVYGYDALDRLTTVAGQVRYSYDPTGNLLRKVEPDLSWDLTLTYTDTAHVHAPAVVSDPALAFSYTLAYDNNGNLTSASRLPFAHPTCQDADLLQWDSENRLAQREIRRFVFDFPRDEPYPKGCLIRLETYAHDGDGRMVKRTDEQGEHVFIGAHYEVQPWVAISYYQFGGRRIAMRESAAGVSDTISYLLADHLGSTRAVVSDGAVTGAQPYLPWGEIKTAHPTYLPNEFKYTANTLPTEYTYTGQRETGATGGLRLLDYGARSYWPFAGRFIAPDTIVPEPGDPQSLNRYSYVRNNPLRYTDPTGMFTEDEIMQYLDVDTWEEVLGMFEDGGEFAGRWGFLRTLRDAELGDKLEIVSGCLIGPCDEKPPRREIAGILRERDGHLVLEGRSIMELTAIANTGDEYRVYGHVFSWAPNYYLANVKYSRPRPQRDIDWVGVGFDLGGVVADAVSFGAAGRVVNAVQVAKNAERIGQALNVTSAGYELGSGVVELYREGHISGTTGRSLFYSGAGFVPGLGTISDAASALDGIFYWGP